MSPIIENRIYTVIVVLLLQIQVGLLLYFFGFFDNPDYLTFIEINFFSVYGYCGGAFVFDFFKKKRGNYVSRDR